jgi:hypothetical protein
MGGFGSGGSNFKGRPTVEECLKLSVTVLNKSGALSRGRRGIIEWKELKVSFEALWDDMLALRWVGTQTPQFIGFQWITHKRALGGYQMYLVCPTCSAPRQALFFHHALFKCRSCHGLAYTSQRERRPDRLRRRLERIAKQLGGCFQWGDNLVPTKPWRMHRKTYDALTNEYRCLLAEYHQEIARQNLPLPDHLCRPY